MSSRRHGLDRCRACPSTSRPSGWPGNSASAQRRVGPVVGLVLAACSELLEDHLALGVDLVRAGTPGAATTSASSVEPEAELAGRQPGVEGGVLAGGEGVHLAADGVDRLGDLARRARARCP